MGHRWGRRWGRRWYGLVHHGPGCSQRSSRDPGAPIVAVRRGALASGGLLDSPSASRGGRPMTSLRLGFAGLLLVLLGPSCWGFAGLIGVITTTKPAVVAIGTLNPLESPRFAFRGSGFAVGDGTLVVTGAHVVPGAAEVETLARLSVLIPRD